MKSEDIYVLSIKEQQDPKNRVYLRSPPSLKPSQCTPLFMAAFTRRNAGCCIHTHSQWAVLVTLLLESQPRSTGSSKHSVFEINNIEQIKGIGRPPAKDGSKRPNLGYFDTLCIPVIENTAHEEDLTESLEEAMEAFPDTYAVLVRRHGIYVWGESVNKAKVQCEWYVISTTRAIMEFLLTPTSSLDYLFQLAIEMKKLGLPWISDVKPTAVDQRLDQ